MDLNALENVLLLWTPVEAAPQMLNSPEEDWGGRDALKSTVAIIQITLFPFCLPAVRIVFEMPNPTPCISEKRPPVDLCVSDCPKVHQGLA